MNMPKFKISILLAIASSFALTANASQNVVRLVPTTPPPHTSDRLEVGIAATTETTKQVQYNNVGEIDFVGFGARATECHSNCTVMEQVVLHSPILGRYDFKVNIDPFGDKQRRKNAAKFYTWGFLPIIVTSDGSSLDKVLKTPLHAHEFEEDSLIIRVRFDYNEDHTAWGMYTETKNPKDVTLKCEGRMIGEKLDFTEDGQKKTALVVDNKTIRDVIKNDPNQILCTSNVTNMSELFSRAAWSGDINSKNFKYWDTSNVTNMHWMFAFWYGGIDLSEIKLWKTSKVKNMSGMFAQSNVNPDISLWDVSEVSDMNYMFVSNNIFNQDLSYWDVRNVVSHEGFDTGTRKWDQDYRPKFKQ